jgi:hypothetical protein
VPLDGQPARPGALRDAALAVAEGGAAPVEPLELGGPQRVGVQQQVERARRALFRAVNKLNAHLPAERRIDVPAGVQATAAPPSAPRSVSKPAGAPNEAMFFRPSAVRLRDDRDLDRLLRG